MPIIRINNYIDEDITSSSSTSSTSSYSESEYSLSPIRYPREREIYINNNDITGNRNYSPSNSSYESHNVDNLDENHLNIEVNDIENNLGNNDYETCLICTENFKDICFLRCGHVICLNCLITWFKTSKTCPFCREEINNLNIDHLYRERNRVRNIIRDDNEEEQEHCLTCRTLERIICYGSIFYWAYTILVSNNIE